MTIADTECLWRGSRRRDKAAEQELFAAGYASLASRVARPAFERFARIAMRRGLAAVVKEQMDAGNNPSLQLRLLPECGNGGGVFALRANLAEQMVEHAACHAPGRGWSGVSVTRSGLHSINHGFLEAGLEQFLRCALEARQGPSADAG